MNNELLIAVLAGLGGMLGWGFSDFFAKKTIDELGDVATLALAHIFGTLCLFIILIVELASGKTFAVPSLAQFGLLLGFGIFQAIIYLLLYRGFGKGQLAVLNPVFASFSGVTALLSIIIFREHVTIMIAVILLIIFCGVLFMNIDLSAFKNRKINFTKVPGFREVFIAMLFAGLWTLFWDRIIGGKEWLIYTLAMYTFMTLFVILVAKVRKVSLKVAKPGLWKFLFLIGAFEVAAYLAVSIGYSMTTKTSLVALLSGAFSLPTILLARAFLKEKITMLQAIGSITIIIGIMLLALL